MFYPNKTPGFHLGKEIHEWKDKCLVQDGIQRPGNQAAPRTSEKRPICLCFGQREEFVVLGKKDEQEKEGIGEIRKENGFGAGSYMMWLPKRSLERRNRPLCLLWCVMWHPLYEVMCVHVNWKCGREVDEKWRDWILRLDLSRAQEAVEATEISLLGIFRNIEEVFGPPEAMEFYMWFLFVSSLLRLYFLQQF